MKNFEKIVKTIKMLNVERVNVVRNSYNSYEKEKRDSLDICNSYNVSINPYHICIESEDFHLHVDTDNLTYDMRTYKLNLSKINEHLYNLTNFLTNIEHKVEHIKMLDNAFEKNANEVNDKFYKQVEELIYTDFQNKFNINEDQYEIKGKTKYVFLYKNNEVVIKQTKAYFKQHFIEYIIRISV